MTNAGKSQCGFSSGKVTNAASDSQLSRTEPLPAAAQLPSQHYDRAVHAGGYHLLLVIEPG